MPTQMLTLTKTKAHEFRARISRLNSMGIPIGDAIDPMPADNRLALEQVNDGSSRIYELPSGAVAVVVSARMLVLKSGLLIVSCGLTTLWNDCPLGLLDPNGIPSYKDLIGELPNHLPTFLHRWLTRKVPLRTRQEEGVIIAHGWSSIPSKYHDETAIPVQLVLDDERGNRLRFDFGVRVDRSIIRKHERRQRERPAFVPSNRTGLFGPNTPQPGDRKHVAHAQTPEPQVTVNDDSIRHGRTPAPIDPNAARETEKAFEAAATKQASRPN